MAYGSNLKFDLKFQEEINPEMAECIRNDVDKFKEPIIKILKKQRPSITVATNTFFGLYFNMLSRAAKTPAECREITIKILEGYIDAIFAESEDS